MLYEETFILLCITPKLFLAKLVLSLMESQGFIIYTQILFHHTPKSLLKHSRVEKKVKRQELNNMTCHGKSSPILKIPVTTCNFTWAPFSWKTQSRKLCFLCVCASCLLQRSPLSHVTYIKLEDDFLLIYIKAASRPFKFPFLPHK